MSSAILAVLSGVASTGLLVTDAAAQVIRRRDDDDVIPPILVLPAQAHPRVLLAGHSSHSSHASHSSHYSGSTGGHSSHRSHYSSRGGGGGGGGGGDDSGDSDSNPVYTPPPPPPKPARVSFVARPGGQIFVDGKAVGRDATGTLVLAPGSYVVRVSNRFLGDHTQTVVLDDGQSGVLEIVW